MMRHKWVQIKSSCASYCFCQLILPQAEHSFTLVTLQLIFFWFETVMSSLSSENMILLVITERSKTVRYLVQTPPTPGPPSRATACRPSIGIANYPAIPPKLHWRTTVTKNTKTLYPLTSRSCSCCASK